MSKKQDLIKLCNLYNFTISEKCNNYDSPLGMGDILNVLSCIKNKLIDNLYINLYIFDFYYKNGLNYLEFRLQLINDIINCDNSILKDNIIIYYNSEIKVIGFNGLLDMNLIKSYKLNYNSENLTIYDIHKFTRPNNNYLNKNIQNNIDNLLTGNYIIFHTKCRFYFSQEEIFNDLKRFSELVKSISCKYTIILLGENNNDFNNNEVVQSTAIIIQIYDILINLKNHNNIIDLTNDIFIDNLNYDIFKKDIKLIQNAKYNIHFGGGGSLCLSLTFAKQNTIVYYKDLFNLGINKFNFELENTYLYNDYLNFYNKILNELVKEIKNEIINYNIIEKIETFGFIENKILKNNIVLLKENKNIFYLCHGGLGDFFNNSGAIRFLSYFYLNFYLFCPNSLLNNLRLLFIDLNNIIFLPYEEWFNKNFIWNVNYFFYENIISYLINIPEYKNLFQTKFDWKKYVLFYNDLNYIDNEKDAVHHWENFGKFEYRDFNWKKYVSHYNDLNYIDNEKDAIHHWINFGIKENREYFLHCFADNEQYLNNKKEKKYIFYLGVDYDFLTCGPIFNSNINLVVPQETLQLYNNFSFKNKISNNNLINYLNNNKIENNNCLIHYDVIKEHYEQLNLPLSIYYNFFYLTTTKNSIEKFNLIKHYNIVFLHFISSHGQSFIPENEWPYIYNEEYLIINPDKNHYNENENPIKFNLANQYLNLLLLDYLDLLKNATDIYICDSCFSSLSYPLKMTNKLMAKKYIIYDRNYPHSYKSTPIPINLSS